ncbi:small, acid-soluble spore protein, alpha/beta type [Bacillus cereus group sp. N11]|uniref:small, acid-soluble spore protein, alpha/beta type n=1 Tax=Bacillus cereus group sp. N11 TaxID=2794585 RepID=UPI0018F5591C|nr:small, acid-soluble spore protein, alpha/beta type [Bacillus cereus group sp. N11]
MECIPRKASTAREIYTANINNNEVLITGAENTIEQMKYEIAKDFDAQLDLDNIFLENCSVC